MVIGAGPAGLSAAHELIRLGRRPIVFEKSAAVGGLARTEVYRGFRFDLGGHRFFTKVREVDRLWQDTLGEDFIRRPRLSRIYYQRRFFYYPIRAMNALRGLGAARGARIVLSYLAAQILPYRREDTFEQWVTNRFGRCLFETFFKSYTEKVWGIPCSELKAEWAAQRIKDLSLRTLLLQMYRRPRRTIRTLVEEFHYPRLGPGMMWQAVRDRVEHAGGEVRLGAEVTRLRRRGRQIQALVVSGDGDEETVPCEQVLSSMPVSELVLKLDPTPPPEVLAAAKRLRYRDFMTVCLIVDRPDVFPDNWIYAHDPEVRVGRIQNFKNWSPDMVPDPRQSSLGLEYFCDEGDDLWSRADPDLIALGAREVERMGLAAAEDVVDGCVVRVPKAYPIYDSDYREALAAVRRFVDDLDNLHTMGRNGLHRYNNQDHAMLTGMLAARNAVLGEDNDLWAVNVDQEYLEEAEAAAEQDALSAAQGDEIPAAIQDTLARIFNKLDPVALGLAAGAVMGSLLLAVTLALAWGGSGDLSRLLGLLRQYFPGYRVSPAGGLLGLAYGLGAGFAMGWGFAVARNMALALYLSIAYGRAERRFLQRLLDYL